MVAAFVLGPGRYLSMRASSRNALLHLRAQPDHRSLEADEQAALSPVQASLGQSAEGGVKRLSGAYRQGHLWFRGGMAAHDLIEGVEVVLPFDARDHLGAHNDMEVVICGESVIVVRVNAFHLPEGYARAFKEQADLVGDVGTVPTALPFPSPAQVLLERDETTEEVALRRSWATLWPGLAAGMSACLVWWVATFDIGRMSWLGLAAGVVLLAVAVALIRRPAAKGVTPGRVQRVRGVFHVLTLPNPGNAAVAETHLLIGSDRRLDLPFDWRNSKRLVSGQWLEAEICLVDGKTLSIGRDWSRVDEQRRFPVTGWGRHAVLFGAAMLAMVWALLSGHGPLDDVRRAAWLFSGSEWRDDVVPATLVNRAPEPGDHLHVRAHGYCVLTGHEGDMEAVPHSDCSRLRWDATPMDAPQITLPPAIGALEVGPRLDIHADPYRSAPERQHANDPVARMMSSALMPRWLMVEGLSPLVELVDRACTEGLPDCDAVYNALLDMPWAFAPAGTGSDATLAWPDLVRLTASGARDTPLRVEERELELLRGLIQGRVDQYVQAQLKALVPALQEARLPGVVLVRDTSADDALQVQESAHERWERTRMELSRPRTVVISGQIIERVDDGRNLYLTIDPAVPSNLGIAGLIHTVWWILALLLVCWHGRWLILRTSPALERSAALAEDIASRRPPGGWERE